MAEPDEPGMGEKVGEHAQLPGIIDHGRSFVLDKRRDEGRRADRDTNARVHAWMTLLDCCSCNFSLSEMELSRGIRMSLSPAPLPFPSSLSLRDMSDLD
jgi:hypothetical protein